MSTKTLYYIIILPFFSLPYPLLYLVSNILYLIIYKLFKYRKAIVYNNLQKAFPNKNNKEIKNIADGFYNHLCNLIIEIFKITTARKSFINKRVKISNIELIDNYAKKNQTIILVSGHFNNWEWAGQKISICAKQKMISIYKPLNNKDLDQIIKKARTKFGAIAISMEESMRYIIKTKSQTQIIGIIADQNPVINSSTKWYSFLGREAPFFMGIEKIAKKMNYPVVFCDMQKVKNGRYNITFENLETEPTKTEDGNITKRYIQRLQKQIIDKPSQWLWSHRRWKHKR